MTIVKEYVICGKCGKEVLKSSFNKHLATHYNPLSRNCHKWYKKYFKKDQGVCVCTIDDEEFFPSIEDGYDDGHQYIDHLKELGITD